MLLPKNIIICCDGTGNEIGSRSSNVFKLSQCLKKGETVFYDPGIGTLGMPDDWDRGRQRLKEVFSLATGVGFYQNIVDSYNFLVKNYEPGDNIYLFGFSRGAYTVRAVAGLINTVGLLNPNQLNLTPYALKAYRNACGSNDLSIGFNFGKDTRAAHPPIKFMGVWDTVNSVMVPNGLNRFCQLKLPYSLQNPSIETVRQALSIDEKRRMFRPKMWLEEPGFFQPPFSDTEKKSQDIKQVWFAGDHSDIGGGYAEHESGLAKIALKWMIDEAEKAGLQVDRRMVSHIVCGEHVPGERKFCTENALAPMHNSLSGAWKALEWWPRKIEAREWPERKSVLGYYIPAGEPRHIPENALIHASVLERMERDPSYRPVNLPAHYRIEGGPEMACPLPATPSAKETIKLNA
jgi:uncharacterized protein (DUF2235 family)